MDGEMKKRCLKVTILGANTVTRLEIFSAVAKETERGESSIEFFYGLDGPREHFMVFDQEDVASNLSAIGKIRLNDETEIQLDRVDQQRALIRQKGSKTSHTKEVDVVHTVPYDPSDLPPELNTIDDTIVEDLTESEPGWAMSDKVVRMLMLYERQQLPPVGEMTIDRLSLEEEITSKWQVGGEKPKHRKEQLTCPGRQCGFNNSKAYLTMQGIPRSQTLHYVTMDGPTIEEYMSKRFILDEIKNHTVKFTVSGEQILYRKDIQVICRNAGVEDEHVNFIYKERKTREWYVVCTDSESTTKLAEMGIVRSWRTAR
ncbi:hypothetical protein ScPMuIL_015174 [Solemya velum]